MRDLVDIMGDEENMMKMGMKIMFRDEDDDKDDGVIPGEDSALGFMVSQYSLGASEYGLRESHLSDKRYRAH